MTTTLAVPAVPCAPPEGTVPRPHPAKFSKSILDRLREVVPEHVPLGSEIIDPFAGVGLVHELAGLGYRTLGVEIEAEWAVHHERTLWGDSTRLPADWRGRFRACVTSPTYGNRMADSYDGRDGSSRTTYRLKLARPLSDNNTGRLHWPGVPYRYLHERVYENVAMVLAEDEDSWVVLNASDFYKGGRLMPVTMWHVATLGRLGFTAVDHIPVPTPRNRHGQNHELRADHESIVVLRRAAA